MTISRWKAEFLERAKMVFDRMPTQADRVYGSEYETPREIRHMLRSYIPHYNTVRPHSFVGNVPPARLYEREQERSA